jgi:ABC-2 type transport system ATP-binding protein
MMMIETDSLTRMFKKFTAVDHLTFGVEQGEIFGLLGPNGAGKTTTIKMLNTLLPPTSGSAKVAGFDVVSQASHVQEVIGYVPQMLSAEGALTGYENLLIFAKLYEVPKKEREGRIEEALKAMGLSDVAGRLVRTYSGGMIRRLEIAQSSLHRPRVMFLDEPTIGLDPVARRSVWELVRKLRDDYGTTILMSTHLMDEAEVLCERVAIMHQAKLVVLGPPAQLKRQAGVETMDEVFIHFTGSAIEVGGSLRAIERERATARRLG